MAKTTTVYKLRLDGDFLGFEEHGDGTEILRVCGYDDEVHASFKNQEDAVRVICDAFYFHHGVGSISEDASAGERLAKIELVKLTVVEEEEVIKPEIYIPTNIEIHKYYVFGRADTGLAMYLKSQVPNWEEHQSPWNHYYDDDGYEFAGYYDRIKDYNGWVAAGKPTKPSRDKWVIQTRERLGG